MLKETVREEKVILKSKGAQCVPTAPVRKLRPRSIECSAQGPMRVVLVRSMSSQQQRPCLPLCTMLSPKNTANLLTVLASCGSH